MGTKAYRFITRRSLAQLTLVIRNLELMENVSERNYGKHSDWNTTDWRKGFEGYQGCS
jgi:hypothetical protein